MRLTACAERARRHRRRCGRRRASPALRPALQAARGLCALDTPAPSPKSQVIGSASAAFFARHQLSATTATASGSCTTRRTPFMPASSRLVDRLQRALEHRALHDGGVQHARQAHVDGVDRLARDLVGDVEAPLPACRSASSPSDPSTGPAPAAASSAAAAATRAERDGAAARAMGDHAVRGACIRRPARSSARRRRRSASRARWRRRGASPAATTLMERLAPVDMLPQTRLRRRFSCGEANSALTLLQSHSSSSATSIGSAVKLPWPISDLATRMMTVSSGSITIQAVISGASDCARAPVGAERDVEAERQRAAGRGGAGEKRAAVDVRAAAHGVCIPLTRWLARRRGSPRGCADRCRNGKCW